MQGCPRITPAGQGNPTTYKELRVGKKRRALSRRLIARRGGGVQLMATVHLARMQVPIQPQADTGDRRRHVRKPNLQAAGVRPPLRIHLGQ